MYATSKVEPPSPFHKVNHHSNTPLRVRGSASRLPGTKGTVLKFCEFMQ